MNNRRRAFTRYAVTEAGSILVLSVGWVVLFHWRGDPCESR